MPPPTEAIFKAIDQDDTSDLESMLKQDPGLVHARHPNPKLYHWTTLQFAAARNEMPGTKFYGMTPLIMNATQKDDCAGVCALLLDAGADINTQDAVGKTAFDWAQETGLKRITAVLENHS